MRGHMGGIPMVEAWHCVGAHHTTTESNANTDDSNKTWNPSPKKKSESWRKNVSMASSVTTRVLNNRKKKNYSPDGAGEDDDDRRAKRPGEQPVGPNRMSPLTLLVLPSTHPLCTTRQTADKSYCSPTMARWWSMILAGMATFGGGASRLYLFYFTKSVVFLAKHKSFPLQYWWPLVYTWYVAVSFQVKKKQFEVLNSHRKVIHRCHGVIVVSIIKRLPIFTMWTTFAFLHDPNSYCM